MIYKFFKLLAFFSLLIILSACEEEITLDMPTGTNKLVVEGYIEPKLPPYIMLTRSIPYFSNLTTEMNNLYVHDAKMKISDGSTSVDLFEVNFKSLPDSLAKMILDVFQLNNPGDLSEINFAFYTTLEMMGEAGKTYTLDIDAENSHLHAVTQIPHPVEPDSIWSQKPLFPVENDSLRIVNILFTDPANEANYYRYFTNRNNEGYFPNRFFSVTDDLLFDGQTNIYPIDRGESRMSEPNFNEYGMFRLGDTVQVKFCTIDKAHYDFWSTFEIALRNGGPFANPLLISSNIEGGLGIWGGYGSSYREIIIKN